MRVEVAGENSLIVYFESDDRRLNNKMVMLLAGSLTDFAPDWLIDITPAYHSLLVTFDPYVTDFLSVKSFLRTCDLTAVRTSPDKQHIHIPVFYGHPKLNDLPRIAKARGITTDEVIKLHSAKVYRVFAVGFAPGFAFLGDVDERISMPRLSTPRKRVPKGAVGIADQQTAVYPNASPGGWNIIGLSPFRFFDPDAAQPLALKVGDDVSFEAISEKEFVQLGGEL